MPSLPSRTSSGVAATAAIDLHQQQPTTTSLLPAIITSSPQRRRPHHFRTAAIISPSQIHRHHQSPLPNRTTTTAAIILPSIATILINHQQPIILPKSNSPKQIRQRHPNVAASSPRLSLPSAIAVARRYSPPPPRLKQQLPLLHCRSRSLPFSLLLGHGFQGKETRKVQNLGNQNK